MPARGNFTPEKKQILEEDSHDEDDQSSESSESDDERQYDEVIEEGDLANIVNEDETNENGELIFPWGYMSDPEHVATMERLRLQNQELLGEIARQDQIQEEMRIKTEQIKANTAAKAEELRVLKEARAAREVEDAEAEVANDEVLNQQNSV